METAIAGFDLPNNGAGMEFFAVSADSELFSQRAPLGPSYTAKTNVGTPGSSTLSSRIASPPGEGIVAEAAMPLR